MSRLKLLVFFICCHIITLTSFSYKSVAICNFNFDLHSDKNSGGPSDKDDIVTKLFSRFLPKPSDIGLTRFDQQSRPENFPCVKDRWATALVGDTPDILLIRQTLANTNLETRPLQLAYSANRDGWNAAKFHASVDKRGPAVVLARSISGGVFGGYNPTGWVNYGEYRGSIAAFLFVFPDGDTKRRPIKLAKIGGAGLAQIDDGSGPKFGSEGLTIPLERSNPKLVRSKLGIYYENMPNGKRSLLPKALPQDELTELLVFVGIYGSGEKIPYSDAIPFALN